MAGKLRSILSQIHWSLAVKAAVFAAAWLVLPYWLFFVLGLLFYFIPTERAGSTGGPFFVLLALAAIADRGPFLALALGVLLYVIFAIRNLLVVDRRTMYEAVVLIIFFLLLYTFYMKAGGNTQTLSLAGAALTAGAFGILMSGLLSCFNDDPSGAALRRSAAWLSGLIMWQFVVAGLFLPLDFTYQSVIVFLLAALVADLLPQYFFGALTREKVLTPVSTVFALLALILGSARWSL